MLPWLVLLALVVLGGSAWLAVRGRSPVVPGARGPGAPRIIFPFLGTTLSEPALEAALRLARAEAAVLVPVYLAQIPRRQPLEAPIERHADAALALLEVVELRAARAGVPVDARIERGRTVRHACRELIAHERFDRMLVAASGGGDQDGLGAEDIAWLLRTAPAEVVVVRPALPARGPAVSGRRPRRPAA